MLFRRCKIPGLINVQVFQFAMFAISYGAVFYGFGSMFFLIIDDKIVIKDSVHILVPSILCLIVWFLINLNLFNVSDIINNYIINSIASANKKNKTIKKKKFRETINV